MNSTLSPAPHWMNVTQISTWTGRHPQTIYAALRSHELRGHQRDKGLAWRAERADVDAWVRGETPLARVVALPARPQRPVGPRR